MDDHQKKKRAADDDDGYHVSNSASDSDSDDGYVIKRRRREQCLLVDKERVLLPVEWRKLNLDEKLPGQKRREFSSRIASYEEHAKTIETGNLENMEYHCGGLGKNNQGFVTPIDVRMRQRNTGWVNENAEAKFPGLQKLEKKKSVVQQQQNDEVRMRPNNEASEFGELKTTLWEALEEKPTESLKESFRSKLMEMRKRREFSTSEGFDVALPKCLAKFNIEEVDEDLRRCLAKLKIEETDEDLWKCLAELKIKETDDDLKRGMEKLKKIAKQRQRSDNLEKIVTILCEIEKENSLGLLTLRSLANYFIDLKWRLSHDYELYDLSCIAYTLALPFFKRMFQHWNPLLKPSHKLKVVSLWKDLLQGEDSYTFNRLVSEVILPAERISCVLNGWNERNPQQMLRFLEGWEKLLPPLVLDSILDSIVIPKLSGLPDLWVRPWLPWLEYKREDLYKRIIKDNSLHFVPD